MPYFLFALLAQALLFLFPAPGAAITKWNGTFSMEDTKVTTPGSSSNLFQAGINLDIKPPTKKQISPRLNAKLNFTDSDKESLWEWDVSPLGNLGIDFTGDSYSFNIQHSNYTTLSAKADQVDSKISRAAFIMTMPDLPRIITDYTTSTTTTSGLTNSEIMTDTKSLFGDYRYKWMNFRGGYSTQDSFSQGSMNFTSDTIFFGTGGSYEIMPRTMLAGDLNLNQGTSQSVSGNQTTSTGKSLGLNLSSSPLDWLGLGGNFKKDINDFDTGTDVVTRTDSQVMDVTGRISPLRPLQFSATIGNRTFADVEKTRSVDYRTLAAGFSDRLRDEIQVGLNISRTTESDPEQGVNIRDNFSLNSTMDLTPRISARVNFSIGRSDNPGFVSNRLPFATGTLADRDAYNNSQEGFIFVDTLNRKIYTKGALPGVWSSVPVPYDLLPEQYKPFNPEQFTVSKTVQFNMIPTDKTSLALSFSSSSNAEKLDVMELGNRNINSSLSYRPNLHTSYSLTGAASFQQTGAAFYSTTAGMAYRFFRGHQLTISYGRTFSDLNETDNLFGGFKLALRKHTSLDFTYGTTQLFSDDQTHFVRARLSKSF